MEWLRGIARKVSGKKAPSATKKKEPRIVFVNNKPKVAKPKPTGTGYYYVRKDSNGKAHKVSVIGRTYSREEAHKKLVAAKK
jgi:hypothetical protein